MGGIHHVFQNVCVSLSLIALLCVVPTVMGQIATVTDNSCTAATTCAGISGHGCQQSAPFTVPTTGEYHIAASIDECGTGISCPNCLAEVYLAKHDNPPNVFLCLHNSCGVSCTSIEQTVTLEKYTEYILYVCKIDCVDDDCSPCGAGYTARATVR